MSPVLPVAARPYLHKNLHEDLLINRLKTGPLKIHYCIVSRICCASFLKFIDFFLWLNKFQKDIFLTFGVIANTDKQLQNDLE